ncbi:MAG: proline--tRNA ligase [Holosporales bacterium]|jgi:prolyl-tRNA synthetase|nr:proline--tRNA ligase [Holosporales bacterium]
MVNSRKHAISVTRSEDFSAWYQAVVAGADLAENSCVRGCMVIKPYGFAIWERIQAILDRRFKELGHVNAYFPMFIPIDLFEKEAEHINGFAKEICVVTHHRLEQRDGKLVPAGEIENPLAIRPTSELIIGESMARWTKSYRDLPLLINQWCNVVRWEMRTRMFLRTSEFLWQEGHTAHETKEEAINEALAMHKVYEDFICHSLKMTAISGKKPNHDKFAGAVDTYTIEAMMQDGKALQSATSHYLGQNFAKAVEIRFQGRDAKLHYAYTTSWGLTTRLIGAIVMAHGDDDGLNIPSAVAPYHVTIIPLLQNGNTSKDAIFDYCEHIKNSLPDGIRVLIDTKDFSPQNKRWDYIRKGVPFILEIGSKELGDHTVSITKRAQNLARYTMSAEEFRVQINDLLLEHDETLGEKNEKSCTKKINDSIKNVAELKEFFAENRNGFVIAKWSGLAKNMEILDEMAVSIRCLPTKQSGMKGKCILTGEDATIDAVFAKSY